MAQGNRTYNIPPTVGCQNANAARGSGRRGLLVYAGLAFALFHGSVASAFAASEIGSPAHPYLGLVILSALVLGLRLTAFARDLDFDRALMAIVCKALRESDLSHKEAALCTGYSPGQWSEIVSCQRPAPSLSRLAFLPKAFWKAFIWDFSSLVIAHKVTALNERRAS